MKKIYYDKPRTFYGLTTKTLIVTFNLNHYLPLTLIVYYFILYIFYKLNSISLSFFKYNLNYKKIHEY